MAQYLNPETNNSHSLQVFVAGVRKVALDMGYEKASDLL